MSELQQKIKDQIKECGNIFLVDENETCLDEWNSLWLQDDVCTYRFPTTMVWVDQYTAKLCYIIGLSYDKNWDETDVYYIPCDSNEVEIQAVNVDMLFDNYPGSIDEAIGLIMSNGNHLDFDKVQELAL